MPSRTHRIPLRAYYADTDAAGVVYYGNYMRFIEIGRTEMLRQRGIDLGWLRDEFKINFAVTDLHARYRRPVKYNDQIVVETRITKVATRGLSLEQDILVEGNPEPVTRFEVELISIGPDFKPVRLPQPVLEKLQ
jgi:acyl-CoA thioester hydrolase